VQLPHIVEISQQQALEELARVGLTARPISVCSHSVPAGIVRQVVQYDGGHELVLDDLKGVTDAGQVVAASTQLVLKVGTGEACA
jgi:hypothetical protein